MKKQFLLILIFAILIAIPYILAYKQSIQIKKLEKDITANKVEINNLEMIIQGDFRDNNIELIEERVEEIEEKVESIDSRIDDVETDLLFR